MRKQKTYVQPDLDAEEDEDWERMIRSGAMKPVKIRVGGIKPHKPVKPTMYFKDEGDYYTYKLTKDGKVTDPNEMYEYGTLKTFVAPTRKRAMELAKAHGWKAVFC